MTKTKSDSELLEELVEKAHEQNHIYSFEKGIVKLVDIAVPDKLVKEVVKETKNLDEIL